METPDKPNSAAEVEMIESPAPAGGTPSRGQLVDAWRKITRGAPDRATSWRSGLDAIRK